MLLTGNLFTPHEALQAGFVHHVSKSDSFLSSAASVRQHSACFSSVVKPFAYATLNVPDRKSNRPDKL
jgi:enoyl-CoA hydratase/carnithine racemase